MPPIINSFTGRYAALSPTYLSGFFYDGDEYQCVAAAFEAAKIFNRADRVSFFAWNCKPWEARRKGKGIPRSWIRPNFDAAEWKILLQIQHAKFSWPEAQKVLLSTEGTELVYGNLAHDNHLGVCLCRETPAAKRKYGLGRHCTGEGENLLGKTLMQVRQDLLVTATSLAS